MAGRRKKKNARDCARLQLGGFRPTLNPVALEKLKREQRLRGFERRWSVATDHPLYDDPDREDSDDESDPDHVYATKLGGYPSNLQHAVEWPDDAFEFVLQIDSEAKVGLMWADRGIVYVGRDISDRARWAVSCQFY